MGCKANIIAKVGNAGTSSKTSTPALALERFIYDFMAINEAKL